jgi:hypothetical protein
MSKSAALDKSPQPEDINGCVMHVDASLTGEFRCADPLLNQLWKTSAGGKRGNFLSVPTDCPQRDERLGWTGDMQIYVRTGIYQMDCAHPSPNGCVMSATVNRIRRIPRCRPRIVVQAEGARLG